jgi:hypothetical protein
MSDINNVDMAMQLLHDCICNVAAAVHGCLATRTNTTQHRHQQASLDSCTGLFSRALHAFKKFAIHLFSYTIGVSMLDLRIRIPVNGDIHNFHMLVVPVFAEHSGEEMFELLSDSLSALDPDWKMKIVGITTNGATSMTGVRKGIVSRIQAIVAKGLIRVWGGAHQLDLALKKTLGRLLEAFLTTLTTMITYLRRQQKLISEMKSKSPYYITVRWSSLC